MNRRNLSRHHIIPRSKEGGNYKINIRHIKQNKHKAYHLLFDDSRPEEAVLILIDKWFYKSKQLKEGYLYYLLEQIQKRIKNEDKRRGPLAGAGV